MKNHEREVLNQEEKLEIVHQENHNEREEELLRKLVKRQAEVQRLQNEAKKLKKERDLVTKNYNTITKSSLYKISAPLRKTLKGFRKLVGLVRRVLIGAKYEQIASEHQVLLKEKQRLEKEVKRSQTKLKQKEEALITKVKREEELLLQLQQVDADELVKRVKQAKEDGRILDSLHELIEHRSLHDERFSTALKYAAKQYLNEDEDLKHLVYKNVLQGLKIEEVPEFIVRSAETSQTVPLYDLSSFRASLTMRARQRQLNNFMPEWILEDKFNAYTFIDDLKIKSPWTNTERYPLKEIPQQSGVVIKPVDGAGSRGVYLVFSLTNIYDVKRADTLTSWNDLEVAMNDDLALGLVKKDEWMIEELIYGNETKDQPARDLKFYCFYGKVALILEVLRYPEVKYCWWTASGERIQTGKYEADLFEGDGIKQAEVELAADISVQIPAPFIRIDFLKSSAGLVFGEFTPKPGHYDQFDKITDELLGEYFLEAETRLHKDLLEGKNFLNFNKLRSIKSNV